MLRRKTIINHLGLTGAMGNRSEGDGESRTMPSFYLGNWVGLVVVPFVDMENASGKVLGQR